MVEDFEAAKLLEASGLEPVRQCHSLRGIAAALTVYEILETRAWPRRLSGRATTLSAMPIKPELRYHYPIDWPQVSRWVRFVRAKGCCETCGRPHGQVVRHLGDGRWSDEAGQAWRDGRGREVPCPARAK